MKIHDLEFFAAPASAGGSAAPVHGLLVRISDHTGLEGWGESWLGWRAERACRAARGPAGRAGRPERLRHRGVAHPGGPCRAAAAIGGGNGRLGPAGPGVAAAVVQSAGRILSAANPRLDPAGRMPREDRRPVSRRTGRTRLPHARRSSPAAGPTKTSKNLAAIREMVGDRVELRFDGLGQFDLETARDLCAGLEFERLQFFLDPLEHRGSSPDGRRWAGRRAFRWRCGGRSAARPTCWPRCAATRRRSW